MTLAVRFRAAASPRLSRIRQVAPMPKQHQIIRHSPVCLEVSGFSIARVGYSEQSSTAPLSLRLESGLYRVKSDSPLDANFAVP